MLRAVKNFITFLAMATPDNAVSSWLSSQMGIRFLFYEDLLLVIFLFKMTPKSSAEVSVNVLLKDKLA